MEAPSSKFLATPVGWLYYLYNYFLTVGFLFQLKIVIEAFLFIFSRNIKLLSM